MCLLLTFSSYPVYRLHVGGICNAQTEMIKSKLAAARARMQLQFKQMHSNDQLIPGCKLRQYEVLSLPKAFVTDVVQIQWQQADQSVQTL